jgi:hypothetical protein
MNLVSALRTHMLVLHCIVASAFLCGAAVGSDMSLQRSQTAVASIRLEYQKNLVRVLPALDNTRDKYLGSGAGTAEGQIVGRIVWDLYENQDNPTLHRTTFVGRISAPGGGRIRFETDGYFVPRAETTAFWDLASAVYFFDAAGPTYRWLEGRIGVWQGFVDTRKGYSHRYKLTLNEQ